MARLTANQRKKMPASKLGIPANKGTKKPTFPLPDADHARAALMLMKGAEKRGSITKAQEAAVKRKADKVLDRGKGTKKSPRKK